MGMGGHRQVGIVGIAVGMGGHGRAKCRKPLRGKGLEVVGIVGIVGIAT